MSTLTKDIEEMKNAKTPEEKKKQKDKVIAGFDKKFKEMSPKNWELFKINLAIKDGSLYKSSDEEHQARLKRIEAIMQDEN